MLCENTLVRLTRSCLFVCPFEMPLKHFATTLNPKSRSHFGSSLLRASKSRRQAVAACCADVGGVGGPGADVQAAGGS